MDAPVNEAEIAERIAALTCWKGAVTAEPLPGGITNRNYVVRDGDRRFVVRLGGDMPIHQISRAHELAASRAAADAGISPAVHHAEPGAVVFDFIDGRTFDAEDIRKEANHRPLIDLVRRTHTAIPRHLRGHAGMFWVFQVVRDYAHTLREGGSRYVGLLPELLAEAEQLEQSVGAIDVVFGHNDLLPANFIDDGTRVWLVDWDYAGFNSPLFDLGGLASNAGLDTPATEHLLELYYQRPATSRLRRRAAAMRAASLLRETLWSMVSEQHSTIDFDYAGYSSGNLKAYWQAIDGLRSME